MTYQGYVDVWRKHWRDRIGNVTLANLTTARVTDTLTELAKDGAGRWQLGHVKWFLSAVYEFARAQSIVPTNPVPPAKWLCKVARPAKQR